MSNERIMILKMLEEGKIGADEATKLLAAIKDDSIETTPTEKSHTAPKFDEKTENIQTNNSNNNNNNTSSVNNSKNINFDELGRTIGSISKNVAQKMGILAKEMAPKLQNITETLVEKTVSVTDKISKSVATPPAPPTPYAPPTPPPAPKTTYKPANVSPSPRTTEKIVPRGKAMEKSCEIEVERNSSNELYITSKSGMVYIKGYNGDKITAKITYTSNGNNIQLSQSGNRYYLDYDDSEFGSVSIEAFVPSRLFKRLHIIAKASKISLDEFYSQEIVVETDGASIILKNLDSNYIKAVTDKGEVWLENITSGSLEVITANAKIDAQAIDVQKLKIETDNSPINYKVISLKRYTNYNWRISTSNDSMRINIPISDDIGYDIKANTSLNIVSAGIAGLKYIYNESNYIEAKTSNFDSAYKKARLELDTSNAPISIN